MTGQNEQKLNQELENLRTTSGLLSTQQRKLNTETYKFLSSIFLWWLEAKEDQDFLDKKLEQVPKRSKNVSYGINFGKVIWLVYGLDSGLDDQYVDRYSRVLNKLKAEFELKPNYYAKDAVEKLANFIHQSGGITKLADYAPKDSGTSEENPSSNPITNQIANSPALTTEQLKSRQKILEDVWAYGPYVEKDIVPYSRYLSTNTNNFALLVVERTSDGINIIDSINDQRIVTDALTSSLSKRFDLIANSIRPLLELVQTQCLPKHLETLAEKLVDKNTLAVENRKRTVTCYRRILFKAATGEFLLSPIQASSGVVSIIKPYFDLLLHKANEDLYMPHTERLLVEQKLLRNFEFNLYYSELKEPPIPEYSNSNLATYVVHLKNAADPNQFQNISFSPFYNSPEDTEPREQLDINPAYVFEPVWQANYAGEEMRRVSDVFLNNWLNSHANYLSREPNKLLLLTFSDNKWVFKFVNLDAEFSESEEVKVESSWGIVGQFTAVFRSKDIIPALKALADLPIAVDVEEPENRYQEIDMSYIPDLANPSTLVQFDPNHLTKFQSGVTLAIDDNVLKIHYYTEVVSGAEHTIYVPIVKDGQASTAPFTLYQAKQTDKPFPYTSIDEIDDQAIELVEVE